MNVRTHRAEFGPPRSHPVIIRRVPGNDEEAARPNGAAKERECVLLPSRVIVIKHEQAGKDGDALVTEWKCESTRSGHRKSLSGTRQQRCGEVDSDGVDAS